MEDPTNKVHIRSFDRLLEEKIMGQEGDTGGKGGVLREQLGRASFDNR